MPWGGPGVPRGGRVLRLKPLKAPAPLACYLRPQLDLLDVRVVFNGMHLGDEVLPEDGSQLHVTETVCGTFDPCSEHAGHYVVYVFFVIRYEVLCETFQMYMGELN